MRIAVTGASGFIGRHVVRALAASGAEVVSAGRREPDERVRGAVHVPLDLGAMHDAGLHARLGRPDVLVHLAWEGLPDYRSAHHVDVELPRQRRFLDACLDGGLRHLVVAGTCLEYGLREGEQSETDAPAPTTAYAEAKCALWRHLEARRATGGFGFAWSRLFYVHGEGQGPRSLRSQLHAAMARGDDAFPMSPGDQQRDFIAAPDAAAILARLAASRIDAGLVNVCSGFPMTVLEMANRWKAAAGSSIRFETGRLPYPDYEPFAAWGARGRLDALERAA